MILLSGTNGIFGQSCDDVLLEEGKINLLKLIAAYKPDQSLKYADSIVNNSKLSSYLQCDNYYWIQYYYAEALELNSKAKEALDIYYKIVNEATKLEKWDLVVSSHISIARVMEIINRSNDCLRHLTEANNLITKYNLSHLLPFYYVRYSSYLRIFQSKDSAKIAAQKALITSQSYNDLRQQTDAYLLLGMLSSDLDTSIYYLQQAIRIFITNGNYDGASGMSLNIASKAKLNNDMELFERWVDSSRIFIHKMPEVNSKYHYLFSKYYELVAYQFEKNNFLDSAIFYLKLSKVRLSNSMYDVNQSDISEAEINQIMSAEKLRSESLIKQAKFQKIALGFLAFGILGISAILFNLRKKQTKINHQNELISSQNIELTKAFDRQSMLLSEVHHRVKNNLQLVISLLMLHFDKVKEKKEYNYLQDISNKVRSIALIHEQLYNTNDFEKIEFGLYLKTLMEHHAALYTRENHLDYHIDSKQRIFLNLDTAMPIGLICTELITNSFKYAKYEGPNLILHFQINAFDDKYVLKYHDNGKTIDPNIAIKPVIGMGTVLIESMVRQLQAESSSIAQGTQSFNLIFKEKKVSQV